MIPVDALFLDGSTKKMSFIFIIITMQPLNKCSHNKGDTELGSVWSFTISVFHIFISLYHNQYQYSYIYIK